MMGIKRDSTFRSLLYESSTPEHVQNNKQNGYLIHEQLK